MRVEAVYIVFENWNHFDLFLMLFGFSTLFFVMCFNVYVYIVYDLQFMITFVLNDVYTCALPSGDK